MVRNTSFVLLFLSWFCCFSVQAQVASPTGTVLEENGAIPDETITLSPTESYTASAPLKMSFNANAEEKEGYTYAYEWVIYPADAPSTPLLRRFEPDTEYTFYESGAFGVKLKITYVNLEDNIELEEESDPISIVISESSLKVPNAFSPNNDGVNDVFMVTYKSLVEFEAYIFNRWGQRIYEWRFADIDKGWDGTFNGSPVKDGVYFIVIKAKGSDGIRYDIKQDINILRGLNGEISNVH